MTAWVSLLGWALALASAASSIPQVARLIRTRRVEGLSPTAHLIWLLSWAMWLWYVTGVRLWPRVASEGSGLLLEIATVGLLFAGLAHAGQAQRALRAAAPLLLLAAAGVLAVRWTVGVNGMAIALTVLDLIGLFPMLRTTVTAPSLAGVSVWGWIVQTAVYVGWIVYGIAIGNPLSAGWMYVFAPVGVFMLARLAVDRGLHARMRARRAG